jgi:hypothetical protein
MKKNLVSRIQISVIRDRDPEIQKLTEMYETEIPRRARSESIFGKEDKSRKKTGKRWSEGGKMCERWRMLEKVEYKKM